MVGQEQGITTETASPVPPLNPSGSGDRRGAGKPCIALNAFKSIQCAATKSNLVGHGGGILRAVQVCVQRHSFAWIVIDADDRSGRMRHALTHSAGAVLGICIFRPPCSPFGARGLVSLRGRIGAAYAGWGALAQ